MLKIYTSIAPFDLERQNEALSTWVAAGYEVISVNNRKEVKKILKKAPSGITIVPVDDTNIFGTTHVTIDKIFEIIAAKEEHTAIIVNSDCKLIDDAVFRRLAEAVEDQLIYCKKWNYDKVGNLNIERHGIDMFMFRSSNLSDIGPSTLCIGKPLWDFWLPWNFHKLGRRIMAVETKFMTHDWHEKKWNRFDYYALENNYRVWPELQHVPRKALSGTIKMTFAQSIVATYT